MEEAVNIIVQESAFDLLCKVLRLRQSVFEFYLDGLKKNVQKQLS
jgi:hypothetical protein